MAFRTSCAAFAVLASLVGGLIFLGSAPPARANTVCGGFQMTYDAGSGRYVAGKEMSDCGFKPATNIGKKTPLKCPAGSFLDIRGQVLHFIRAAECWSCPAGYKRNATKVDAHNACYRPASKGFRRAQDLGVVQCKRSGPASMFLDPRNGGECWSCPDGYRRTSYPVTKGNWACRVGLTKKWAKATFHGTPCPDGAFKKNGRCYRCPTGTRRTAHGVTSDRACAAHYARSTARATMVKKVGCPKNTFFDPIQGGTCWSCPVGYSRNWNKVTSPKACVTTGLVWKPDPVKEPGLWGIQGAERIAARLFKHPSDITNSLRLMAPLVVKNPAKRNAYVADTWAAIAKNPGQSPAFQAIMFSALMKAIQSNDPDSRKFVAGFEQYMTWRKTAMIQDAMTHYQAWDKTNRDGWRAVARAKNPVTVHYFGAKPPNFLEESMRQISPGQQAAMGIILTGGLTLGATTAASVAGRLPVFAFTHPHAAIDVVIQQRSAANALNSFKEAVTAARGAEKVAEAAEEAIQTASTAAKAARGLASGFSSSLAAAAGPLVITAISGAILQAGLESIIAQDMAWPTLQKAMKEARKGVSLKKLTNNGNTLNSTVQLYWALATATPKQDSNPLVREATFAYNGEKFAGHLNMGAVKATAATAVTTAAAPAAGNWAALPGNARDIAVAADGTAWVIGMDKRPGGYAIYFRGPRANRWTEAGGGATRIAAAGNRVWVINNEGAVFQRDGNKWVSRGNPHARDIGASGAAIYVVGGRKVPGGYQVMQWKGGTTWKTYNGGGVRIAVDAQGVPWIVNDKGFIYAMKAPNRWRRFMGQGTDIAVRAADSPAVIDMHGELYVFDKAWHAEQRRGIAVASAPGGRVWYLGPKNEIFRPK